MRHVDHVAMSYQPFSSIVTPVKLSKEKGSILAAWLRWGKGKYSCGKLIDQADSLISFVIVITCVCVWMCVCWCVYSTRRERPTKRESLWRGPAVWGIWSWKDAWVTYFSHQKSNLFITRQVEGQTRSSHSHQPVLRTSRGMSKNLISFYALVTLA